MDYAQPMVYEPLCLWECWTCDRQFVFATLYPPILCPFCFDTGSVNMVDNLEDIGWRPENTEGEIEGEEDGVG